jgi:hypothetical protein
MIHYQTWPPQAILVSDWPIFLSFSMLSEIYVQVIVKIAMATKIPISLPIAN